MRYFFLIFVGWINQSILAQSADRPWNGKHCAIVLTYDDAIDEHLDHAIPVLDSLGLKASFYLTASSKSIAKRMNEWRALPLKGHELGNHSLFHPCMGGLGREWVSQEYDLRNYSKKRMLDELTMTNIFLHAVDGKNERTFAFTCGDMKIGGEAFLDSRRDDFVAARAVRNEMPKWQEVQLYDIPSYMVNKHSFEEMKRWVDEAIQKRALLVILFHGVGGGNGLDVGIDDHRKLLAYIQQKREFIYNATLLDLAKFMKLYSKHR